MKRGVPSTMPVLVLKSSERMRAMPKSMIFTCPRASSMMLPGLMSRCTTPRSCAKASPSATWWDVDRVRRGERRLQQALAQVGPLEQLHRQVSEVALLAEIVGRDDVRMRELAGGLGLLEKALVVILAALGVVAQDDGLQRDDAVEVRVLGAVDDPHSAATELA